MNAVESLKLFLPELCLIGGAFSVLTVDLFIKNKKILTLTDIFFDACNMKPIPEESI